MECISDFVSGQIVDLLSDDWTKTVTNLTNSLSCFFTKHIWSSRASPETILVKRSIAWQSPVKGNLLRAGLCSEANTSCVMFYAFATSLVWNLLNFSCLQTLVSTLILPAGEINPLKSENE